VQEAWGHVYEEPSDNELEVTKQLVNDRDDNSDDVLEGPFPPQVDNLSVHTEPQSPSSSQSSALSSQYATPSATALSLPSYHSPEAESRYSDSGFTPGPHHSGCKTKEINYVVSDKDEIAFDEAYAEGVKLYILSATDRGEPRSYREAKSLNNPDSKHWIEVVQTKLKSLQGHGTWEVVPRPEGKQIITCKWVWRVKIHEDGSIEHYKACLVARGFTQTHGVNFNETFAPVTRLDNLRLLIAHAVQNDWEFCQIDVKTTYLYGDLKEEGF